MRAVYQAELQQMFLGEFGDEVEFCDERLGVNARQCKTMRDAWR